MTIEPHLDGIWKRYTPNNIGLINAEKNAFVHAYSHFAYEYSMKNILSQHIILYYLISPSVCYLTADTADCDGPPRGEDEPAVLPHGSCRALRQTTR